MCRAMDKIKGTETARDKLLTAAAKVVRERGVTALTLEATAREAGVSKGGLLYHFATKQALIAAMVAAFGERVMREVGELQKHYEGQPGALTRAIIGHTERNAGQDDKMPVALIAALATDAELLEPARQLSRDRFQALHADKIPFEIAAIANLAADGLWFMELLGIEPLSVDDRARIFAALRELVDGAL
jgi:AcrR family transcriptional regulator